MATGPITKRAVDAATPGSFLWDDEVRGFGLKVTAAGARSYVYQYRLGGRAAKVRRYAIGPHGVWTPDAARREARRLAQLVDTGVDPAAEKQARQRQAVDLAFPAYAERFIAEYLVPNWKGGHELASGILRRDIIPFFRRKALPEIGRADVATLMDRLASKPAGRRNAFAVLRRLFRWAVIRGDLLASPVRDMDSPPAPASRDRGLTDEELAIVWRAAELLGYPFGPFVQLLILTGQRRAEVAGLEWSELSRDEARWTLPASRSKNGAAHEVPLSDPVIKLLDELAGRATALISTEWPREGLVFSSTGAKAISGYSVAKRRLDGHVAKTAHALLERPRCPSKFAAWRFHDLRRTMATGLQKLGVRFEVTEAVLNHVSGARSGIAGVYQRHDRRAEKRTALSNWAAHVASVRGSL